MKQAPDTVFGHDQVPEIGLSDAHGESQAAGDFSALRPCVLAGAGDDRWPAARRPEELPIEIGSGHSNTQYDLALDGRIYYLDPRPLPSPTEIRLILGWQALLR